MGLELGGLSSVSWPANVELRTLKFKICCFQLSETQTSKIKIKFIENGRLLRSFKIK